MKKILFAAAVCLAMTACNKDEERLIPFLDLDITVADNGFVSEDGSSANPRTFNVGDRIGLYAVSGGALVEGFSNLCITAYGSNDNLSWRVEDRAMEFPSNAVYYAYYPYQETLTGNVDVAASNADEFFSAIIAHWSVAEDQSGDGFNQSDLTYGSGSFGGDVLNISMEHAFGLVTANMGGTVYKFTNTDYEIADYTISTGIEFTGVIPRTMNGVLNYIVKPGTFSLSGTQNGEEWKFDGTAEAGHCYSFSNGESTVIEHNLQIGDFYLADGNLLSKDADASEVAAAHVIGVVCQIDPERIGEGERNALGGTAHALVLASRIYGGDAVPVSERRFYTDYALYDETQNIELAVDRDEKTIGFPEVPRELTGADLCAAADEDISGYTSTHLIYEKRAEDMAAGNYPGFSAVSIFHTQVGGPVDGVSTGWFMPAGGQLLDAVRNFSGLTLSGDTANPGEWGGVLSWSGCGDVGTVINTTILAKISDENKTEYSETHNGTMVATQASNQMHRFVDLGVHGYVEYLCDWKNTTSYVRPMLAF